MRGKVFLVCAWKKVAGITPAYAGKSWASPQMHTTTGDHPRLCGEKPQTAALFLRRSGSPPPMRGKVQRHSFSFSALRITPAYAGKRL